MKGKIVRNILAELHSFEMLYLCWRGAKGGFRYYQFWFFNTTVRSLYWMFLCDISNQFSATRSDFVRSSYSVEQMEPTATNFMNGLTPKYNLPFKGCQPSNYSLLYLQHYEHYAEINFILADVGLRNVCGIRKRWKW